MNRWVLDSGARADSSDPGGRPRLRYCCVLEYPDVVHSCGDLEPGWWVFERATNRSFARRMRGPFPREFDARREAFCFDVDLAEDEAAWEAMS